MTFFLLLPQSPWDAPAKTVFPITKLKTKFHKMIFYFESYCSDSQPRDFASKETFGNVWEHFWLSQGGAAEVPAPSRGERPGTLPAFSRAQNRPHTAELSSPKVTSAGVEKVWFLLKHSSCGWLNCLGVEIQGCGHKATTCFVSCPGHDLGFPANSESPVIRNIIGYLKPSQSLTYAPAE